MYVRRIVPALQEDAERRVELDLFSVRSQPAKEVFGDRRDVVSVLAEGREAEPGGDPLPEVVGSSRSPVPPAPRSSSRSVEGWTSVCPFRRRVADSVARCSGAMTLEAMREDRRPRRGRWSRHPGHRASRDRSRRRMGHPLPRTCPPGARRGSSPSCVPTKVLQSIVTNSSLNGRGSSSWINRATTSLPVPLSPIRRTEASLKRATSTISRRREVHASVRPASASCTSEEWTSPSTSAQRLRRAETSSARLASSSPNHDIRGPGVEERPGADVVDRLRGCPDGEDADPASAGSPYEFQNVFGDPIEDDQADVGPIGGRWRRSPHHVGQRGTHAGCRC